MRIHGVLKRLLPMCTVLLVCLVSMPGSVLGADVDVYAEGAYTDTDLVVYIYADIASEPILSFGVKVEYPSTLTYSGATKNESVWYFGDGGAEYSYMDPEDDGSGVVIIGGKLDTSDPTEGVQGDRVLLGTVTFTHSIVDPQDSDFASVSVTYGRGDGTGDYKNFVDVDGDVVDGTASFSSDIHERGDANGNGSINVQDILNAKTWLGNPDAPPWVDCNGDGTINVQDILCIKSEL